jgi:hypothetical protein
MIQNPQNAHFDLPLFPNSKATSLSVSLGELILKATTAFVSMYHRY